MSEINNKQVDGTKDVDTVMPMYNLIEYSDIYLRTSGRLQQYHRDEPAIDNNGRIGDFPADNNNSISFKFKEKITGKAGTDGTKGVNIMVLLKYISDFWRTLAVPLINRGINFILNWFANCFLVDGIATNHVGTFIKLMQSVMIYRNFIDSRLEHLKYGLKRTSNWNKYDSKITTETQINILII